MLSLKIIAIGKKPENHLSAALDYYEQRLKPYLKIEWLLIPHAATEGKNQAEINLACSTESTQIIQKIDKLVGSNQAESKIILLDERGEQWTSPIFAEQIKNWEDQGNRQIIFVIGGAYGVDEQLKKRADKLWSLSKLVFPHQLVRLILLEQIYRSQMIWAGKKYHHE